jgi:hypothetical protein
VFTIAYADFRAVQKREARVSDITVARNHVYGSAVHYAQADVRDKFTPETSTLHRTCGAREVAPRPSLGQGHTLTYML